MQSSHMTKLVILGRDGVLNEYHDDHIKSPDEWIPVPGALEAVARLNQAGWRCVVATNQSGLGRGLLDMTSVNAIHLRMNQALAQVGGRIDAVFFCPHEPQFQCDCRKPLPGMMFKIAERFNVDLAQVPMVGDTARDMLAAKAAGCPAHLILNGRAAHLVSDELQSLNHEVSHLHTHATLDDFVTYLLSSVPQD